MFTLKNVLEMTFIIVFNYILGLTRANSVLRSKWFRSLIYYLLKFLIYISLALVRSKESDKTFMACFSLQLHDESAFRLNDGPILMFSSDSW